MSRGRRPPSAIVLLVGAALAVTACGSTVSRAGSGASVADGSGVTAPGSDGLGDASVLAPAVGQGGTGTSPGGLPDDVGVGSGPEAGGSQPQLKSAGDGAGGARGAAGAGGSRAAPAGPLAPVKVGVYVLEGFDSFASSAGYDLNIGDGRRQAGAIIADLNKRGGLAGHRIEPVFAVRNSQSDESFAVQDQRACSAWTEDNRVVAAVSAINTTDVLPRCLSARRVPFVASNIVGWTAESFAEAPYFIGPAMLNQTRMAPVYVDRLAAQGFFREGAGRTGATIGLLRFDTPRFARVARDGIEPALARHGLRLSQEAAFSKPARTSDNGATLAEMQSAVLRFQSEGVTHVLMLDETGFIGIGFLTAAESSGYRPRYGLTTYSAPGVLETLVPQEQLKKASGIDWVGGLGPPEQQPSDTAEIARCRKIVRDAGEDASDGSLAWGVAIGYCARCSLSTRSRTASRRCRVQHGSKVSRPWALRIGR